MIRATIELDRVGKHTGALVAPRSTDTSAWAQLTVPIVSIRSGPGPTVIVLAGNHGDEYEGQVVVAQLAQELEETSVTGHLILVPCLSAEASLAGTRTWPDGTNFNRSFPGRAEGHLAEQLAHYLADELFPVADAVCDIHSGGRSMRFFPMSHMHVVEDAGQRARMLDAMLAWNTPLHMLYDVDVAGGGLLPVEAARRGATVVTTELGGGGHVPASTHRIARGGLENVLRHLGVLEGTPETRSSLGLPDPTVLDARARDAYVYAPRSGLYQTFVDPGDPVEHGNALGVVISPEHPTERPTVVTAPRPGVVCAVRALARTSVGDCLAVVGTPVAVESLR